MTVDDELAITQERDKSRRAREAAERNAAVQDFDTAANRLYYAALHLAKAVLLTEGLDPKSHRGVKRLLVVHFVSPGLLPDWVEPALARLETERDLADYASGFTVPAARYESCRIEGERLLDALEAFLERVASGGARPSGTV